jgi:hypothetical protein
MANGAHYRFSELNLEGRYEILQDVRGSPGLRVRLGAKGVCRFCGCSDLSKFRKVAHTFPEALNNKWVISLDECDDCNALFSLYEDALASSVSPFLTLGGVRGKRNKIRQTGRSKGYSVLERRTDFERGQIFASTTLDATRSPLDINPVTGKIHIGIDIADVPFRPRHAYKALAKMGLALLPDEEICNYQKLKAWLLDTNDAEEFPTLEVGMSFGCVGNALPLVSGTLLRRVSPDDMVPHILFIFCAGSVCFQIDLLSDHKEDHIPPVPRGSVNIQFSMVLGEPGSREAIKIEYSKPIYLNSAARDTQPQLVKTMLLDFDPRTCHGRFTPVFRGQ